MVDGYEHLEHFQRLVYYQLSGDAGITGCNAVAVWSSRQSDIYLQKWGHMGAGLFIDHCHVMFIFVC